MASESLRENGEHIRTGGSTTVLEMGRLGLGQMPTELNFLKLGEQQLSWASTRRISARCT